MRLYAYYSCGGYKDMFLGELSSNSVPVYYLPLLPIIKRRNNPDDYIKIKEQECLPKIEIITNSDSKGFPPQCNSLFSHGAYNLIYECLDSGEHVLAIRGIESSTKDEDGRSIPFNLLFVTDNECDLVFLDSTAYYCSHNFLNLSNELSETIVYDTKVNGLRADIQNIWLWITMCKNSWHHEYKQVRNSIILLMLTNESMLDLFLKEHMVDIRTINEVMDVNGNIISKEVAFNSVNNSFNNGGISKDDVEYDMKQLGKDLVFDKALKKIKCLIGSITK